MRPKKSTNKTDKFLDKFPDKFPIIIESIEDWFTFCKLDCIIGSKRDEVWVDVWENTYSIVKPSMIVLSPPLIELELDNFQDLGKRRGVLLQKEICIQILQLLIFFINTKKMEAKIEEEVIEEEPFLSRMRDTWRLESLLMYWYVTTTTRQSHKQTITVKQWTVSGVDQNENTENLRKLERETRRRRRWWHDKGSRKECLARIQLEMKRRRPPS